MPQNTIGKKIKEAIRNAGITQSELARRLELTPQQINNWIAGKSNPSLKKFLEMLEVLGKDISYFLHASAKTDFPKEIALLKKEIELLKLKFSSLRDGKD